MHGCSGQHGDVSTWPVTGALADASAPWRTLEQSNTIIAPLCVPIALGAMVKETVQAR
jgi:hypothetical protein